MTATAFSAWSLSMTFSRPPSPTTGGGANPTHARSATHPRARSPTSAQSRDLVMTEPNAARGQADSAPKPTPGGDPPTANLAVVSRPSAVLDAAHLGDIEGAFGRIRVADTDVRRTVKTRLLTPLAIMGPGLIVMVGDNDAGGVATYAEA